MKYLIFRVHPDLEWFVFPDGKYLRYEYRSYQTGHVVTDRGQIDPGNDWKAAARAWFKTIRPSYQGIGVEVGADF